MTDHFLCSRCIFYMFDHLLKPTDTLVLDRTGRQHLCCKKLLIKMHINNTEN